MAAANMELFDQYFKRADLDRDGRISGAEAVAFFQGSNLPKQVLAQVPFLLLHFLKFSMISMFSSISSGFVGNHWFCVEFLIEM